MLKAKNLNIIGALMFFLGLSMIPSSLWSFFASTSYSYSDKEFYDFLAIIKSSFISIIIGLFLFLLTKYRRNNNAKHLKSKDGFVIVTLGWISITFLSALPYYFSFTHLSFTNAFFE